LQATATPAAYGLPTPEQIANLAAHLARGTDYNPDLLAHAALKLWMASERVHHEASDYYRPPDAVATIKEGLSNLPQSLDRFLLETLPQTRPENRRRAWKLYNLTRAGIKQDEATAEQETAAATRWEPFENQNDCIVAAGHFLAWWTEFHASERSETNRQNRRQRAKARRKARPPVKKLREAIAPY